MKESIDKAWDFVWNRLFCEKTKLFYDYLVSDDADAAISHLPSPEIIKLQAPNPCGWGTGMEDSMINGGTVLDTVIARYNVTGEKEMKDYAARIYEGMRHCATVSPRSGFLARSVSPVDGVTHYSNSSRDQYTHFVYGMCRFYDSPLSTEAQRGEIRRILAAFADRFEADVTPENEYIVQREDGKMAYVCKMWGEVGVHEYLRLPMMYAAAWKVTGDPHWKELYLKYRDEAMQKSYPIDFSIFGEGAFALFQMQNSLRLVYEIDTETEFRKRCEKLMKELGDQCEPQAVAALESICRPENKEKLSFRFRPWDAMDGWQGAIKAAYCGIIGDKPYYIHEQLTNNFLWRGVNAGQSASLAAMDPCRRVADTTLAAVENAIDAIDYKTHYSRLPIGLLHAYWTIREKNYS